MNTLIIGSANEIYIGTQFLSEGLAILIVDGALVSLFIRIFIFDLNKFIYVSFLVDVAATLRLDHSDCGS